MTFKPPDLFKIKKIDNIVVGVNPTEEQHLKEEFYNREKRNNIRNFLGDSEYNVYRKHALRQKPHLAVGRRYMNRSDF